MSVTDTPEAKKHFGMSKEEAHKADICISCKRKLGLCNFVMPSQLHEYFVTAIGPCCADTVADKVLGRG